MPPKCTICYHQNREEIDKALVAGVPLRIVAEQYGTSATALHRHKKSHISKAVARAQEAIEDVRSFNLLAEIEQLQEDAKRISQKAEDAEDYRAAVMAVRELLRIIEFMGKLTGDRGKEPQAGKEISINISGNIQQLNVQVLTIDERAQLEHLVRKAIVGPVG